MSYPSSVLRPATAIADATMAARQYCPNICALQSVHRVCELPGRAGDAQPPVDHTSIFQPKPRGMPRTDDAVTNQLALRQRRAEVGTRLRHGKQPVASADQQDGYAIIFGATRLLIL